VESTFHVCVVHRPKPNNTIYLLSTGIGLSTVKFLARAGAKVYLAARNESKAIAAIEELKKDGLGPKGGEVIWLKLDLNDPAGTKAAAEEVLVREKRLDILVNNAAL
jgi:NAD(P)-dependent dehydrogenase (short-subunit alcohol dehydrogenase family)